VRTPAASSRVSIHRHRDGCSLHEAVAHLLRIGKVQTGGGPFGMGQFCRADLDPVLVIWSVVARHGAMGWVDFACVSEMGVHGWIS
jgi:hypothetical protein